MQDRRKYRINWFKLTTIIVSSYFVYLCVNQQIELNAIGHEAEAARKELGQFQQINAALTEERNALNDRKYVEKLAREELGLVKPGEIPYILSEKNNL